MKKICALGLAILLVFSLYPVAEAEAAAPAASDPGIGRDVPAAHWAYGYISRLAEKGVMNGYDGYFTPDSKVKRQEFFALINRAFGYNRTDRESDVFSDVDYNSDSWSVETIRIASANGYLRGGDNGMVNGTAEITREQAFAILARVYKLEKMDGDTGFMDDAEISAWAKGEVRALQASGFLSGRDGKLAPQENLTRAEAAKIISVAMGTRFDEAGKHDLKGQSLGNVTISVPGVTLSNATIDGDLYITEGIGLGGVFLENVEVRGRTVVSGGGVNSIVFIDTELGKVVIHVPDNAPVRLRLQGTSAAASIDVLSPAIVEGGTGDVVIDVPAGAEVDLKGRFGKVTVNSGNTHLVVAGSVESLEIMPGAEHAKITGGANISAAAVRANGVVFDTFPPTISADEKLAEPPKQLSPNQQTGTDPGTDSGTSPGTDPGTNPGTDPGTNPGTDPGTNPGTDPGTGPGEGAVLQSIVLHAPNTAVRAGDSLMITPEAYNSDNTIMEGVRFVFSSSDESVATVGDNGAVAGVSAGSATITVTGESAGVTKTAEYSISVLNEAVELSMEPIFTIQPDDGGINQFPDLFKFGNDIFVTFSKHQDAAISNGLNGMRISRDNGLTFDEYSESTAFTPGNMAQLKDGRLFFVQLGSRIEENKVRVFSWVSTDAGKTWTKRSGELHTTGDTFSRGGAGLSSIVFSGIPFVESDGTIYNTLYGHYIQDSKYRVLLAKSTDNGLNWTVVSTVASGLPSVPLEREADGFAEPSVARVADGSLLAVMRTRTKLPMLQARSYDNGLTWTEPVKLPDTNGGHISDYDASSVYPKLLLMSNGILALSYGRPDAKLLISTDGSGYQWDYLTVVYDDPTDLTQNSGMTGIVETEQNRLLIVSDTGAVAYNPPVKSIWGRYINVRTAMSSTRDFSKAYIESNIDKIPLNGNSDSVHVIVFDQDGRIIPAAEYETDYASDNDSVVKVGADGSLTPIGAGAANITATVTYQGGSHPITRQVKVIDDSMITELEYKAVNTNLLPNEQTRLIAWVKNGLGKIVTDDVSFTYESSEPSSATVSSGGIVTAGEAFGKARVRIAASKNGITLEAYADITVVRNIEAPISFEGETGLPAGFTSLLGESSIEANEHGSVLRISDIHSTEAATVELVGTKTATKVFETRAYPKVLSKGFVLLLMSFNGIKEVAYQINISPDGAINYYTDASYPIAPPGTISANQWYKFRMEADSLGSTRLYIDDRFIGAIPKRTESLVTVDRAQFIVGSSTGTKDVVYFDEIAFFEPTDLNMSLASFTATADAANLPVESRAQIGTISQNAYGLSLYDVQYEYSSSDDRIAAVNANGEIVGNAAGNAVITVKASKGSVMLERTIAISVINDGLDSVTASAVKGTITAGSSTSVQASAKTADGVVITGVELSFGSSDEGVAKISGSGVVTGLAEGTAIITVTAVYKGVAKTAQVSVNVLPEKDDFERYEAGGLPLDFTSVSLVNQVTDTQGYHSAKSFEMWDNAAGASAIAEIAKEASASKTAQFMIKQKLDQTKAGAIVLNFASESGITAYQIKIDPNGTVSSYTGSAPSVISGASIAYDKWYKLSFTLNISGESTLVIEDPANGASTTHVLPLASVTASDISKLKITCGRSAGVIDRMYIDDFMFIDREAE